VHIIENTEFGVRIFDAICQSSMDVIISGFGGHIDISGCRSLLYLFVETTFHLYPRFVVGILTVYVSQFQIYMYFRFRPPFPIVGHYWNHLVTLPARLPWSNAVGSSLEC